MLRFSLDKDNDLRCRVNKRAHKLFGKEDNEHKKAWIDDEFRKRQQKRKEKERRKGMIDNSLGAAQPNDLNTLAQHFLPPQQQGQALPDMNYLTMLCNSLGISGAARALIGNAAAAAFSHTTVPEPSHETVAMEPKMTEINAENKDESEETTTKPNVEAGTENVVTTQPTDITSSQDNGETENKDQNRSGSSAPLQLIEFLQHLQQYQPQQQNIIESNSSSSELAALPAFPGMDASRPEEKLAALLASTLQAAAAAATSKEDGSERSPAAGNASSSSAAPAEHTEFPLDAVLTLMQLNAGWRQ
ncbi:hypothetical protein G6F56_005297 [Rhizopus delemar]|nr:hypothetical protein G6F56_005297 [Rhizopus delemar]